MLPAACYSKINLYFFLSSAFSSSVSLAFSYWTSILSLLLRY